jgi:transcriptional regulator with XRE-family HTH domain
MSRKQAHRLWGHLEDVSAGRAADAFEAIGDEADARVMRLLHLVRPPVLNDSPDTRRRALQRVRELAGESSTHGGVLPPLLRSLRTRLGITRRDLAGDLTLHLGLQESMRAKVKRRYADLESGLLPAGYLDYRLVQALAELLRVEPDEIQGAARFASRPAQPAAAAFARAAGREHARRSTSRRLDVGLDEVDRLFLGGVDDLA